MEIIKVIFNYYGGLMASIQDQEPPVCVPFKRF